MQGGTGRSRGREPLLPPASGGIQTILDDYAARIRRLELLVATAAFGGDPHKLIRHTDIRQTPPGIDDVPTWNGQQWVFTHKTAIAATGGGVVAYDAVVDPNYTGADGDAVTLSTGSVVFIYKTAQAAHDAWASGAITPTGNGLVLRLNRDNNAGDLTTTDNPPSGQLFLIGESAGTVSTGVNDGVNVIGTITIKHGTMPVVIQGVTIFTQLVAAAAAFPPGADLAGMPVELRRVAVDEIQGAFAGDFMRVAMDDCWVQTDWLIDATHQASGNVLSWFVNSLFEGPVGGDSDAQIGGIYVWKGCRFIYGFVGGGGTFAQGFPVTTDKHFIFEGCHFDGGAGVNFELNGGTLTLEIVACKFAPGAGNGIFIYDHGGGGTANIHILGEGTVDVSGAGTVVVNIDRDVETDNADWIDLTDGGVTALHSHGGGGGGSPITWSETPAGTINGSNPTFTLAAPPSPATALLLYKNGILQRAGAGNDFTLSSLTITFLAGNLPQTGDILLATYQT